MVLATWAESGLSLAAFARRFAIGTERLRRWRRRLGDGAEQMPTFHPVRLLVAAEQSGNGGSEDSGVALVLRGGRRVSVRSGFDAAVLAELVRVVETWSC